MAQSVLTSLRLVLLALALLLINDAGSRNIYSTGILLVLYFGLGAETIWRYHRAGILKMTPKQIYLLPRRPALSFIDWLAVVVATVALINVI
jgi:hypothetical protein